jgi:hypothetical protein
MSKAIRFYQYASPLILTPLAFHLWWREYQNWPQTMVSLLIPVLWAYLVPGIGTNICKVWEFDVRWKLGRFRPHHGFVFGSATAMIAWAIHGANATTVPGIARYAFILCSVLGFWNLLYEVRVLKSGILKVYTQPWANGCGEEAIAMDYSPWFFGGFGAAYGSSIALFEYIVNRWGMPGLLVCLFYWLAAFSLCVALPVLGFMQYSWRTHGHAGIRPVEKKG